VLNRLGDFSAAIEAWQQLNQITWFDLTTWPEVGDEMRPLLQRPEAAVLRAQLQAGSRWTDAPSLATPFRASLPVEERIAGLSRIWAVARDAFVWFDHVPELDWDRAYLETIPKVIAAPDTATYYRELMRFVALLHDGHSNVYPPKELENDFYSRPGLLTARIDGRVIVTRIYDHGLMTQGLRVGDEILAIDGVDVTQYAEERVVPYESSSTPQDRDVRAYSYALLAGMADKPAQLAIRDAADKHSTIAAPRSGYSESGSERAAPFAIRKDGVAVLVADEFEDAAAVKLLGEHGDEVMQAKGLIIDLRGNGGGSSGYGTALLRWLSRDPLPSMIATYRDTNGARVYEQKEATIRWRELDGGGPGQPRDRVFNGRVAMLIDARTFSAAEDTAAIFRLMKRGIIVGMPSGGSTGQPWFFNLPGGGQGRICVKRDRYPDGTSFVGTGVIPDIQVSPTIADIRAGRDPVIERAARELIHAAPVRPN
jgi:carboxyl-terminal processing protease